MGFFIFNSWIVLSGGFCFSKIRKNHKKDENQENCILWQNYKIEFNVLIKKLIYFKENSGWFK